MRNPSVLEHFISLSVCKSIQVIQKNKVQDVYYT